MGEAHRLHQPQPTMMYSSRGFQTVRVGIAQGDNRFRPRLFGVGHVEGVLFWG